MENKNYRCKSTEDCNGKNCCGDAKDLFCCVSPEKSKTASAESLEFSTLPELKELISKYQQLSIPMNDPGGTSYFNLQTMTDSSSIRAQALYAEALGYKQIAQLRREYIGLPVNILVEKSEGKIELKEAPAVFRDLTDKPCGEAGYLCIKLEDPDKETYTCSKNCEDPNFLCCNKLEAAKTKVADKTTSKNIILKKALAGDYIQLIFVPSWASAGESGWGWCKGTFSCKNYVKIASNSPPDDEVKSDYYLKILRDLASKTYKDGINYTLYQFVELSVNEKYIPKLIIRDEKGNDLIVSIEIAREPRYPLQKIARIKIGKDVVGDIALGSYVGSSDVFHPYTIELNNDVFNEVLDKIKKEGLYK